MVNIQLADIQSEWHMEKISSSHIDLKVESTPDVSVIFRCARRVFAVLLRLEI